MRSITDRSVVCMQLSPSPAVFKAGTQATRQDDAGTPRRRGQVNRDRLHFYSLHISQVTPRYLSDGHRAMSGSDTDTQPYQKNGENL